MHSKLQLILVYYFRKNYLCKRMIVMYEVALNLLEHLKLIVFGSLFGNYLPNLFQKIIKSKHDFIRELLQKNF